jgi:predicted alpha/beta-hydrolase family hydrolase
MRIIQILTSLAQPSYPYFAYNRRRGAIAARCKTLKKIIQRLDKPKHAIALSRSSGGRVSSLIADELQLKQIICLGYPFKHPTKNEQAERYQHLAKLRTPMLIFQGVKDQYGGSEVLEKYPLSPMVQVELVDTDHHFEIEHDRLQIIANKIQNIIESPTTES